VELLQYFHKPGRAIQSSFRFMSGIKLKMSDVQRDIFQINIVYTYES